MRLLPPETPTEQHSRAQGHAGHVARGVCRLARTHCPARATCPDPWRLLEMHPEEIRTPCEPRCSLPGNPQTRFLLLSSELLSEPAFRSEFWALPCPVEKGQGSPACPAHQHLMARTANWKAPGHQPAPQPCSCSHGLCSCPKLHGFISSCRMWVLATEKGVHPCRSLLPPGEQQSPLRPWQGPFSPAQEFFLSTYGKKKELSAGQGLRVARTCSGRGRLAVPGSSALGMARFCLPGLPGRDSALAPGHVTGALAASGRSLTW